MKLYGDNRGRAIAPQIASENSCATSVKLLENVQNTLLTKVTF